MAVVLEHAAFEWKCDVPSFLGHHPQERAVRCERQRPEWLRDAGSELRCIAKLTPHLLHQPPFYGAKEGFSHLK